MSASLFYWLGDEGSNLDRRSQSPLGVLSHIFIKYNKNLIIHCKYGHLCCVLFPVSSP